MHVNRGVWLGLMVLVLAAPAMAQQQQEEYVSRFFPGVTGAGARAMGMGGAFIAIADDATAASWNPAGLAVLERPEVSLVGQPLAKATMKDPAYTFNWHSVGNWGGGQGSEDFSSTRYDPATQSPESRSFDFASVTVPLRFRSVKIVPQISRQRVIDLSFDDAYSYGGSTQDRYITTCPWAGCPYETRTGPWPVSESYTITGGGGLDVWALSLGVSFTPQVYVGLAVNRWGGTSTNGNLGVFTTTYGNGRVTDTNTTTQTQEFSGTSVHFGALVKPTRRVNLGFVFRPSFGMKLNSRAVGTSQHQDTRAAAAASSGNSTATYDGTLDWPQTIGAGLAVMPTDFLTFSADYTKTSWSKATFNHVYDYTSQSFNAQGQPVGAPYHQRIEQGSLLWPNYWDSRDPQTWSAHQTDSAQVRVGAEYVLRNLKLLNLVVVPLRVGFVSDGQMTMNAPTPTKATYTGMTAGFGLVWKKVSLDFAWIHMTGDSTYGYEGPVIGAGTSFSYQMNYRADGSSSFSSNRLFASTVIRF